MSLHVNLSFGIYVADHPGGMQSQICAIGQKAPNGQIAKTNEASERGYLAFAVERRELGL